jgi:hypothetical protein
MKVMNATASRYGTFTKLAGGQFKGDIISSSGMQGDTSLDAPFLVLETRSRAQLVAGEAFTAPDGKIYLAAERNNRYHRDDVIKLFNIIPLNMQVPWLQFLAPTDTVTGLPGTPTYTAHPTTPTVWVFMEPIGPRSDGLQVEMEMYRLITGYDVRQKDKINGKTVQSVIRHLGVNVAEAK